MKRTDAQHGKIKTRCKLCYSSSFYGEKIKYIIFIFGGVPGEILTSWLYCYHHFHHHLHHHPTTQNDVK